MSGFPIKVEFIEERSIKGMKRHWTRVIMPKAHLAMGKFWHNKLLKRHFTQRARQTYGHRRRSTRDKKGRVAPDGHSYVAQKMRHAREGRTWRNSGETVKQSGKVDNVLTGNLRSALERLATIQAFPTRVSVKMIAPEYAPMKPRDPSQPDKIAEIFRNTPEEKDAMAKVLGEVSRDMIDKHRAKRRTKT